MAENLYIVIATAGRPDLLGRTLASLADCRKPDNYRKTIVVENGPKCGAEEIVKSFDARLRTQYVYVPLGNKSNALTTVLRMVGECLIFFTDDDVRIHPDTLCAYAEAAIGTEMGKFYGGPTGADYEREPPSWLIDYLPNAAHSWQMTPGVDSIPQAGLPLGFNWAAFARDLRDAGGFDVKKGPGAVTGSTGQEADMEKRLLKNGVPGIYIPEAMVWHYVPVERCSPKWAARFAYRTGIWRGMDYRKQIPTILGFPRWMFRKWLKKGFKVLRTLTSKDMRTYFDAYYEFRYFSGFMRGSRIARRSSSYSYME